LKKRITYNFFVWIASGYKKTAIFDSSVKYRGSVYTSSLNFPGAMVLCCVSYMCHIIYVYMGWTLVGGSRLATARLRTSVEVLMDAVWECYEVCTFCYPHVVGSVRSTPPPTWGFQRCMLFEHLSFAILVCTFAILYSPTAFFHVLQSSEQV
jgi:hypothetical protein